MTAAALAAALLLVGAASAWAAFVVEGSPYTVGSDPYSLNAGDFNGDGRPDVVTLNGSSSDVSVFLRQAGGGFAQEAGSPVSLAGSPGPSGGAVGDYNGDGRHGPRGVELRRGQRVGAAAPAGRRFRARGHSDPAQLADQRDRRGRLQQRRTARSGGDAVLRQPGRAPDAQRQNTGFVAEAPIATGLTPRAIAVGDYNGDGLADLAITNLGDDSVTILRRVATGGFTAEATLQVGDQPNGIVAADFDGNGRADLAVASYGAGAVYAFLRRSSNDGFDAEAPITVSATPVGIDAADFDRDGRPDLAVASNAGAVDILIRNAGGSFTRDQPIPLAPAVNDVVAADFDGDSRPDLAATSYSNTPTPDTFSVLLNPAPPGPTLPPPVAGKTVNVEPVSGKVRIRRPGSNRFVTLTAEAQIPVGSSIDTRNGRIAITAAQGAGKTASADFYDGLFKLTQAKRSKVTSLTLTERLSCPRKGSASAAAKKKKKRAAVGRRQRQVPHQGQAQRRDRGRHEVAGRGSLQVDAHARRPRPRQGARLREEEDGDRARRQALHGAREAQVEPARPQHAPEKALMRR